MMKKNILFAIMVFGAVAVFNSCTTPPIEAAQDAYDFNSIVPKVLGGIDGPDIAIQTFTADYTIGYYRGGSTWNWSATDATVKSVSDDTRVATIEFTQFPASGKAIVTVTETTMGGITSDPVNIEVTVKKYCALANGVADLVGNWTGDDAGYESIITTEVNGSKLTVAGMSVGIITGWWGEVILEGGTFLLTVNEDGTVDIPRQYIYTTEYDGAPYRYEIMGNGTWDNCTATPSLLITYDIYYEGDASGIGVDYGDGKFVANIQLAN